MSVPASAEDGSSRLALLVLVALVVIAPWPFGAVHPVAVQVISLVALVTSLTVLVRRAVRGEPAGFGLVAWPLAGLFLLGVFQLLPLPGALLAVVAPGPSAIWRPSVPTAVAVLGGGPHPVSVHPAATLATIAFGTGVIALALLAVPALRTRRVALRAAVAVVGGGLLVAVYGVVAQTLFGPRLYGAITVPIKPFGPFLSKNHFSGYVEMGALLALGLAVGLADESRRGEAALGWTASRRAGRVVAAAGIAAAMGLAVLVSRSLGGAVSLGAGALSFVLLRLATRRSRGGRRSVVLGAIAVATLAGVALVAMPQESRDRLASLAGSNDDLSRQLRVGVMADTLHLIARSPAVGYGLGAFRDAFPTARTFVSPNRIDHAESDLLEMAAEAGIIGLSMLLAALWLAGRAVARGLAQSADRGLRGLGLGAAAAACALLVHCLFDFNLRIPSNALLFAFMGAMALAAVPAETGASEPESARPRPRHRLSLLVASIVVALALAAAAWTPAHRERPLPEEASAFLAPGGRPVTPLRLQQATEAVTISLRRRPANAEAWVFLAWLRTSTGAIEEGAALARYAAALDPEWQALQVEARRFEESR